MPPMADAEAPPVGPPISDALRAGRDAYAAHDWQVAHDRLLEQLSPAHLAASLRS